MHKRRRNDHLLSAEEEKLLENAEHLTNPNGFAIDPALMNVGGGGNAPSTGGEVHPAPDVDLNNHKGESIGLGNTSLNPSGNRSTSNNEDTSVPANVEERRHSQESAAAKGGKREGSATPNPKNFVAVGESMKIGR
ncbi:MAG: hypothetical protein M1816_001258 [Peltula sp. TS41687]|nr:MAG: hypothetical protein M1816_001258 [Peltula sp. TS41687]